MSKNKKTKENAKSQIKNAKKSLVNTPFLKKIVIQDKSLVRFKSNYAANLEQDTKFSTKLTCMDLLKNVHDDHNEILEGASKDIQKTKKKKSLSFLYYILNIAVIAIVLAVQLSGEENPAESLSAISQVNWWFILAAFGTVVMGTILSQIRYASLIHKSTGTFRLALSYKLDALGRYYDTITPLATGGQPFQVIYCNKYGIKAGEGISIAVGKYIFYQIVYFILVSYFVFRSVFSNSVAVGVTDISSGVVSTFMWVGYAILAVLVITMLVMSLNRRVGASVVVGILKLLSKIKIGKFRIIKDYKKSFVKVMKTVNVWQSTTKKYVKSFWVILINVVMSVLFFMVSYSLPFFIFCAFEGWHPELYFTIISMAVMIDLTCAFNPIPMGTGTADLSFAVLYGSLFTVSGASIWALLIWRFLNYYIYILQGLVIVNYDYFVGNKRLEKHKEYWMLPLRERAKYRKQQAILDKTKADQ